MICPSNPVFGLPRGLCNSTFFNSISINRISSVFYFSQWPPWTTLKKQKSENYLTCMIWMILEVFAEMNWNLSCNHLDLLSPTVMWFCMPLFDPSFRNLWSMDARIWRRWKWSNRFSRILSRKELFLTTWLNETTGSALYLDVSNISRWSDSVSRIGTSTYIEQLGGKW